MNNDPAALLPQQILESAVSSALNFAWLILWSPAGALLLAVLTLRLLLALALYIKRDLDRLSRM